MYKIVIFFLLRVLIHIMNKSKFWHIFLKNTGYYCNGLSKKYPSCTNEISKDELLDPPQVIGFY